MINIWMDRGKVGCAADVWEISVDILKTGPHWNPLKVTELILFTASIVPQWGKLQTFTAQFQAYKG